MFDILVIRLMGFNYSGSWLLLVSLSLKKLITLLNHNAFRWQT